MPKRVRQREKKQAHSQEVVDLGLEPSSLVPCALASSEIREVQYFSVSQNFGQNGVLTHALILRETSFS